jgi:hypothetical protein
MVLGAAEETVPRTPQKRTVSGDCIDMKSLLSKSLYRCHRTASEKNTSLLLPLCTPQQPNLTPNTSTISQAIVGAGLLSDAADRQCLHCEEDNGQDEHTADSGHNPGFHGLVHAAIAATDRRVRRCICF